MKRTIAVIAGLFLSACLPGYPDEARAPTAGQSINVEVLVEGLKSPWSVAVMPGGGYLITEKANGLKRIFLDGRVLTVKGVPEDVFTEGQAGYFDVKIAPGYTDTMNIYMSYAFGTATENGTGLFSAELQGPGPNGDGLTLTSGKTVFRASPTKDTNAHFGGRLAFLPDDTLVLTLGDGFAYREQAQVKGSDLGKIVRLKRDGSAAKDNPFVGQSDAKPEIYSWGHRNAQGLHYDAESKNLWAHEHGPKGGDELNLLKSGANYGWPIATTGIDYNGAKITPLTSAPNMESYVKDWVPSIAPSGLTIYRGDMFPDWNGDAFVGGLASRDLRRLDLEGNQFVKEESLLADLGGRVRDVRTAPDGALLVLIDNPDNGKLLRLTPN